MNYRLSWAEFKSQCSSRGISMQYIQVGDAYHLAAKDDWFIIQCLIPLDTSDASDFEANYKAAANAKLNLNGGRRSSPIDVPDTWFLQLHEYEFMTSTSGSIHERNRLNQDMGYCTMTFYDAGGAAITPDGNGIAQGCVHTVIDWTPPHQYALRAGSVKQAVVPSTPVYVWLTVAPTILKAYGGNATIAEGGWNLEYLDARYAVEAERTGAKVLKYNDPIPGTNTIRTDVRHGATLQHRLQVVFKIYVPAGT